jgi:hypothetical protein
MVKENTIDTGSHKLARGGTIAGHLPVQLAADCAVAVVATDTHGIEIEQPDRSPVGKECAISNLWPGRWTLVLKRGETIVAKKAVTLHGNETISCDLSIK